MTSQADAMKRLLAIEEQNRVDKQGPYLERLATNSGISINEILAESERIHSATAMLTHREQLEWVAADAGMTIDELLAEADALLAFEGDEKSGQ
jgi:hypothetical protein